MKILIKTLLFAISGLLSLVELNAARIRHNFASHAIYLTVDGTGIVTKATVKNNRAPDNEYYKNNNYMQRFVETPTLLLYVAYIHDNGSLLGVQAPLEPHPDPSIWHIAFEGRFFRLDVDFKLELPVVINLIPANRYVPFASRRGTSVAGMHFFVIRGSQNEIVGASLH